MRISVVVPTYNRRAILERTLQALFAQNLAAEDYEVIVVVDGATDGTAAMVRGLKPPCMLRILEIANAGPAAARNAGLRVATGELALLLDDDLIAVPDLLRLHCAAHTGEGQRVVHGPIYIEPGSVETIVRHVSEEFYDSYYHSLSPEMELHYPDEIGSRIAVLSSLANSSARREFLLACGGFDEEIRAAEDLEFGLRLWKAGGSFRYAPEAIAYEHYIKSTLDYLRWQERTLASGDLRASRKHPEYRPYGSLSTLAETRPSKRWLRNGVMRFPVSPVGLLAFPLRMERWFYRIAWMRRAGVRLLRVAERVMRLRSGLKAVGSGQALESEFGRRCPALLYHRIGPKCAGVDLGLTIEPEKFEQQIRWLARKGYVGITSAQWLRWLNEGTGLPEKPILITFDDGYADTAQLAFPILRRYGFGAVMFVVTGRLGGTNTWDEAQGSATLQLMTAKQIQYWAKNGIEFGSHTRTHADLTKLTAEGYANEIEGSKRDLATLGVNAVSFAYPYGAQNDAVQAEAGRHFELCFSVEEGVNYLRTERRLLRRAYVGPDDSMLEFALGVSQGRMERMHRWRIRLGLRTRLRRLLGGAAG